MKQEDFQQHLLQTFRAEAEEHIQGMASGLLELEKSSSPEALSSCLETIFRQAHNLKGAARAVNASEIESICQLLESVFAAMKRRELALSTELLDSLHQAVNSLQELLVVSRTQTGSAPGLASRLKEQLAQ